MSKVVEASNKSDAHHWQHSLLVSINYPSVHCHTCDFLFPTFRSTPLRPYPQGTKTDPNLGIKPDPNLVLADLILCSAKTDPNLDTKPDPNLALADLILYNASKKADIPATVFVWRFEILEI